MGGRGARYFKKGDSGIKGKASTQSTIGSIRRMVAEELKGKIFKKSIVVGNQQKNISFEIQSRGLSHIANDIHSHKVIKPSKIKFLSEYLQRSSFTGHSPKNHLRKDACRNFYYFTDKKTGITFNVGEKITNEKVSYSLYAITRK